MEPVDGRWEWFVSMANAGYPRVVVSVDEVLLAARRAGLTERGWERIERQEKKRVELFEKRRPLVAGDGDLDVGAWFCEAFHDLADTAMLELHFRAAPSKAGSESQRRAMTMSRGR